MSNTASIDLALDALQTLLPRDPLSANANHGAPDKAAFNPAAQMKSLAACDAVNNLSGTLLPTENAIAILDAVGVANVLESISSGVLPSQLAHNLQVPQLVFRNWCAKNIDPDDAVTATRCCAEMLQYKSILAASASVSSPAEATQARQLSQRYAEIAAQLDVDSWNNAPRVEPEAPPAPATIIVQTTAVAGDAQVAQFTPDVSKTEAPPQQKSSVDAELINEMIDAQDANMARDVVKLKKAQETARLEAAHATIHDAEIVEEADAHEAIETYAKERPFEITTPTEEDLESDSAAARQRALARKGLKETASLDIVSHVDAEYQRTKNNDPSALAHMDEFASQTDDFELDPEEIEEKTGSLEGIQTLASMLKG